MSKLTIVAGKERSWASIYENDRSESAYLDVYYVQDQNGKVHATEDSPYMAKIKLEQLEKEQHE